MFQFTTTHVINSNFDLTTNKALWSLGFDKDANVSLHIKGVNNFVAPNVTKIYKAPYTEAEMAQVEIDLNEMPTSVKKGDTIRLSVYIRLTEADQCSYYANDTRFKGRPFTVEFEWLGNAQDTLKKIVKIIRKYGLFVFEKEVIKTTVNGTKLVLTAVNEFQRFHTVKLEKYLNPETPYAQEWEELDDMVTVVNKGVEGFGTYGWILRNLKLPTHEHTRAFAPGQNEMPIPGAHYNQYTIHYCSEGGPLGRNTVGDIIKTTSTHVLYINTALLEDSVNMTDEVVAVDKDGADITVGAANFEAALKTLADAADADAWVEVVPNV